MKYLILTFFITIISFTSFAQIVNVEKKRMTQSGFNANFAFSLNIQNTGTLLTQLSNTTDIQYHKNASSFILLNDLSLLRYDGGDLINNGFQHLRYNYTVKDTSFLTLELFTQHQYNEQKILKRRILLGGGPRFRLIRTPSILWYFAPLFMYEQEQRSDENNTQTDFIRGDAYTNISYSISKEVSLNHISYYQPKMDEFKNFRYSGETGLSVAITKYLAFTSSFALDYDSMPPEGIPNMFYYFKNRIQIRL